MEGVGIGEFARRSRLSPKALRLYDEMGLLLPARVDAASGYRFYGVDQLEQARFVATLRQLKVPLAEIKAILALAPGLAAQRIADYWATAETDHAARRDLAGFLINRRDQRNPAPQPVVPEAQRRRASRGLGAGQGVRGAVQGAPGAAHGGTGRGRVLHLLGRDQRRQRRTA